MKVLKESPRNPDGPFSVDVLCPCCEAQLRVEKEDIFAVWYWRNNLFRYHATCPICTTSLNISGLPCYIKSRIEKTVPKEKCLSC